MPIFLLLRGYGGSYLNEYLAYIGLRVARPVDGELGTLFLPDEYQLADLGVMEGLVEIRTKNRISCARNPMPLTPTPLRNKEMHLQTSP